MFSSNTQSMNGPRVPPGVTRLSSICHVGGSEANYFTNIGGGFAQQLI